MHVLLLAVVALQEAHEVLVVQLTAALDERPHPPERLREQVVERLGTRGAREHRG